MVVSSQQPENHSRTKTWARKCSGFPTAATALHGFGI